jgi:hypothetical protein
MNFQMTIAQQEKLDNQEPELNEFEASEADTAYFAHSLVRMCKLISS